MCTRSSGAARATGGVLLVLLLSSAAWAQPPVEYRVSFPATKAGPQVFDGLADTRK
jgi:hypothetical protein